MKPKIIAGNSSEISLLRSVLLESLQIAEASRAVTRAISLTNSIIEINPPSKIEKFQSLNLNVIAQSIKEVAKGSVSKSLELKLDLALDLDLIQGNTEKIQALLWQLLLNAIQAIEEKSTGKQIENITIKTSNESIASPEDIIPVDYVVLRVTDSGSGVSEQESKEIFDIFHSCRLQRPWISLNVVKIISEYHSAIIKLERCVEAEGTTFAVYFPAVKAVDKPVVAVAKVAEQLSSKISSKTLLMKIKTWFKQ